jgi:opacity protein-like surface antigen
MRLPLLSLALAASALAQPVSVGVKAGMPLTDFVSTVQNQNVSGALGRLVDFHSNTRPYVFGASIELRLPAKFGIELDALYRRLNYSGTDVTNGVTSTSTVSSTSASAWEFPLLLKYRFGPKIVKPYVEAGFAWDTLTGLKQSVQRTVATIKGSSTTSTPPELHKTGTSGFVTGAGLDLHALVIHIAPEIRYTHWGSPHFEDPAGLVKSKQSQAEFLVGITF